MSGVDKKQLIISLVSIKETGFSFKPDLRESDVDKINWLIGFRPLLQGDQISVEVRSVAIVTETNMEVASCSILMTYKVENLEQFASKESEMSVRVDDQLMLNMLNPAMGTLRGTMYVRFLGTPLERIPLPLISVADMINNAKKR